MKKEQETRRETRKEQIKRGNKIDIHLLIRTYSNHHLLVTLFLMHKCQLKITETKYKQNTANSQENSPLITCYSLFGAIHNMFIHFIYNLLRAFASIYYYQTCTKRTFLSLVGCYKRREKDFELERKRKYQN